MKPNNNTLLKSVALIMGVVLILSAGFAGVAIADDDGFDNDDVEHDYTCSNDWYAVANPGDCATDIVERTDRYENISDVYNSVEEDNFFSTASPAGQATEWAVVGDAAFRYVHYKHGAPISNSHYWVKEIATVKEDARDKDKLNLYTGENGDLERVYLPNSHVKLDIKSKNSQFTWSTETLGEEYDFFKTIANNTQSVSLDPTEDNDDGEDTEDGTEENGSDGEDILDYLDNTAGGNSSVGGAIVDVDTFATPPVSIFATSFKDSQTENEVFEEKSTPPYSNVKGEVQSFKNITLDNGTTGQISTQEGEANVGFGIYRIPDSQVAHIVVEAPSYPENAQIILTDRDGEKLMETDFQRTIALDSETVDYINKSNEIFAVINTDEKINMNCMSIVTKKDNPQTCDEGQLRYEAVGSQDTDKGTDEDEDSSSQNTRPGSILDYSAFSIPSSQYPSSYYDGGELGYMERSMDVETNPHGTVEGFPKSIDGESNTAATLSSQGRMDIGIAFDNSPFGQNHVFVMNYSATGGPFRVTAESVGGNEKTELIPQGTSGKFAISVGENVSRNVNNSGALFVEIESPDNTAAMNVSCMKVLTNVENINEAQCGETGDISAPINNSEAPEEGYSPSPSFNINTESGIQNLQTGEEITLDASDTIDPDGDVSEYKWIIESEKTVKYGEVVNHTFEEAGDHTITLEVTDEKGNTEGEVKYVQVESGSYTQYRYVVQNEEFENEEQTEEPEGESWTKISKVEEKEITETKEEFTRPGPDYEDNGPIRTIEGGTINESFEYNAVSTGPSGSFVDDFDSNNLNKWNKQNLSSMDVSFPGSTVKFHSQSSGGGHNDAEYQKIIDVNNINNATAKGRFKLDMTNNNRDHTIRVRYVLMDGNNDIGEIRYYTRYEGQHGTLGCHTRGWCTKRQNSWDNNTGYRTDIRARDSWASYNDNLGQMVKDHTSVDPQRVDKVKVIMGAHSAWTTPSNHYFDYVGLETSADSGNNNTKEFPGKSDANSFKPIVKETCNDPGKCDFDFEMEESGKILMVASASNNTDNNDNWDLEMHLDGSEVAHSTEGSSDNSTHDSQTIVALENINAGTHSVDTKDKSNNDNDYNDAEVIILKVPYYADNAKMNTCSNPNNCDFTMDYDGNGGVAVFAHSYAKDGNTHNWDLAAEVDNGTTFKSEEGSSDRSTYDNQYISGYETNISGNANIDVSSSGSVRNWGQTQIVALDIADDAQVETDRCSNANNCEYTHNGNGDMFVTGYAYAKDGNNHNWSLELNASNLLFESKEGSSYDETFDNQGVVSKTRINGSQHVSLSSSSVDNNKSASLLSMTPSQSVINSKNNTHVEYDDGLMYNGNGEYIKFAEEQNDGRLKYAIDAPENNGDVNVDIHFKASSFEGSGATIYAVDTKGNKKTIQCDPGISGLEVPDCDSDSSVNFEWDNQGEVTMDEEIDKVIFAVDMENALGDWGDEGKLYDASVSSTGGTVKEWVKYSEPVYEWERKIITEEEKIALERPNNYSNIVGGESGIQEETRTCEEGELAEYSTKCNSNASGTGEKVISEEKYYEEVNTGN